MLTAELLEAEDTGDFSKALEMAHCWAKKDPEFRISAQQQLECLKWLQEDVEWKLACAGEPSDSSTGGC